MTEPQPRTVPIDGFEIVDEEPTTIRVNPPPGAREVGAFARLAAVFERVPTTEVPQSEPPASDIHIHVHSRPPEPHGSGARLRQEALDALARAETDHEAALARSRRCWETVHDTEVEVAVVLADESEALRAFEVTRDRRRNLERTLRRARAEGRAASQQCLTTSRALDGARIRAERL